MNNSFQQSSGSSGKKGKFKKPKRQCISKKKAKEELQQLSVPGGLDLSKCLRHRRYTRYRNEGKSIEEAYQLILLPSEKKPSKKALKKMAERQERLEEKKERAKINPNIIVEYPKRNMMGDKLKSFEAGVVHSNHPQTFLSNEQAEEAKKLILAELFTAAEQGVQLQFDGIHIKPGVMFINCLDEFTYKWLEEKSTQLKLQGNTSIKTVPVDRGFINVGLTVPKYKPPPPKRHKNWGVKKRFTGPFI